MAPMASPKGYSLTKFARGADAAAAMKLIRFLTNEDTQREYLVQQKILPSRLALRDAFRRGSLVPIRLPELQLQRQFYMVQQKNKYLTSGIRSLMAHIREGVASASTADIELPLIP